MEEKLELSKYKLFLYLLKIIPIIIAGISLANTVLSLYNIDIPFLSYIGGISFLTLIFIYFASFVFRFCIYHRIFIYYIAINNVFNLLDYIYYFDIDSREYISIHLIIAAITLFIALYFKLRHDRIIKETNNK